MILPAQHIRLREGMIIPFVERGVFNGMSFGLSAAGYDVRIDQDISLHPGQFILASTIEHFDIPTDVMAILHDKSSWARQGVVVQNTVFEPGWKGYATLEITDHRYYGEEIIIPSGSPIGQLVFHQLAASTEQPYCGKYQHQERGPQSSREERTY